MTQQHQYQLAKRGKWICPECGRKTFVCYVDANGKVLDEGVGKCDRADKCAYHYPPRQYFADNNLMGVGVPRPRQSRPIFKPQPRPTYIDNDKVFKPSVIATMSHRNNLVDYLKTVFDADTVGKMVQDYFVGTSKHFGGGATVFWQIDRYGKIHRGKVMQYDPTNGKRVKEPFQMFTTVHKLMNLGDNLPPQCLFGEHLLPDNPDMTVAIVESEKTAIIASGVVKDCIFLACGGCGNLTIAMCEALRGRNVVLFPDNGKHAEWSEKGRKLRHLFKTLSIVDIMERPEILQRWKLNGGDDIGDLILACNLDPKHIQIELKEL